MGYISEQKYVRLFFTVLKLNPQFNLLNPSEEDKQYIINLTYLLDTIKPGMFGFTYEIKDEKLFTNQVLSSLSFIAMDFNGIVNDIISEQKKLQNIEERFREEIDLWYVNDILNDNLIDSDYVNKIAFALYIKKLSDSRTYSEAKKYITKNKIQFSDETLLMLKGTWKELSSIKGI